MPKGKHPTPPPVSREVAINETVAREDFQAADKTAALIAAINVDQVGFSQLIGERLGRRRAVDAFSKLVTVTDLLELQRIKQSRAYRGMSIADNDGKVVTVTTWAEFCEVVERRSVEQVDSDLLNLKIYGADFLEATRRLGIGYRELREMRSIPADERTELLAAAETADKAAFIEIAESLIEKHAAEKTKVEKRAVKAEQSVAAKDRLIDEYHEEIDSLKSFTPSAETIARNLEEQTQLEELARQLNGCDLCFRALANVVAAINQGDSVPVRLRAQQAVEYVVSSLAQTVYAHGFEIDISSLNTEPPEWAFPLNNAGQPDPKQ